MARTENQKQKLLVLLDILRRETDEDHCLNASQLARMLEEQGIHAERKSVYADIDALNTFSQDEFLIEKKDGRGGGYYITEYPFEIAELKLLIDAVYASRFITERKTKKMVDKLAGFASRYQREELKRKILVGGRIKSQEEQILVTVDHLHAAIAAGEQVQFKYRKWSLDKKLVSRHSGRIYQVSPWDLVWENGNYYLIAHTADGTGNGIRVYRVDKLQNVRQLEGVKNEGREEYDSFDINEYLRQIFSMYSGPVRQVTVRCANELINPILDRFGTDVIIVPDADGAHFTVTVKIQESAQFYGWIFGLGDQIEIVHPQSVRDGYLRHLEGVKKIYDTDSSKISR